MSRRAPVFVAKLSANVSARSHRAARRGSPAFAGRSGAMRPMIGPVPAIMKGRRNSAGRSTFRQKTGYPFISASVDGALRRRLNAPYLLQKQLVLILSLHRRRLVGRNVKQARAGQNLVNLVFRSRIHHWGLKDFMVTIRETISTL